MIPQFFVLTTLLLTFGTLSASLAFPNNVDRSSERHWRSHKRSTWRSQSSSATWSAEFMGTKLVNDRAHPWRPPRAEDERGPCPGMNTLASHGYISRDRVATPAQIVTSLVFRLGFNMENKFAIFVTYLTHLFNGNLVTDLLSIGGKTRKTGPSPPPPAHAAVSTSTEPSRFSFKNVRFFGAYGEPVLPINFFVDGRGTDKRLDMASALSFLKDMRYPPDFFRSPMLVSTQGIAEIFAMHPFQPGGNADGKVNNFVVDPTSADFTKPCVLYDDILNTVKTLYPNPTGVLRQNLIKNLRYFYTGVPTVLGSDCRGNTAGNRLQVLSGHRRNLSPKPFFYCFIVLPFQYLL
ncbi:heme-thiolate peroxidase, partial [Candolleomyces eurysporus]